MFDQAAGLAERIRRARHVKVVSHIDADGLTSAAIAARALDRLGVPYEVEFLKSLTPEHAERLLDENPETLWFTDLGAGAADRFARVEPVISDHHVPVAGGKYHLNPHFFGEDGARYACGASTTYLVARALSRENRDLAHLAVVGAVGDLQDVDAGRLGGLHRQILADAAEAGVLRAVEDVRYFGRETRPVHKLLQYAEDPPIPGVSGREGACCDILTDLGVGFRAEDGWRTWTMLSREEKRRVLSAIAKSLLAKGYGSQAVRRLVGEVYVLPGEAEGTPLRDAKEFATLLNSTARYGEAGVGLAVAMGDRGEAYERAQALLQGHRAALVAGLAHARAVGVREGRWVQWFHAGSGIRDTILGIVAGMLYASGSARRDLPMIAFSVESPGKVKVSARASRALVDAGLNLSEVMRHAASTVGGAGGGHAPAAGATIPSGTEERFLAETEAVIEAQLKGRGHVH